ncbi:MAG: hypothetical protein PHX44_03755 [Sulfurimonas sp.]|uniref:c-type cytochrome n=1 Tax=Sulfurimonas sp. TaxID=2022749 RepID=UPI002639118E|nr:hypothetical protein [Sulfurimonas sp.]MDD2652145.1 hypothetical protein [Sulfurimonas sp.]MDD3450572.1 hypothetical protein [Sulfurimonas sp.]
MKIKNLALLCIVTSLGLLSGCSDSSKQEGKEKKAASEVTSAQKIEVVKNENAQEIKVALKEGDENQSKSYYYDYNVKSAYNPNMQPANDDASVREKARSAIDANLHVRSPYENVEISMLVKKLSKEFIVKCSACHNDYANGVIGPSLLGRDADFIFEKISKFKDGSATNVLMKDLVSQMDTKEIRAMADEIYEFNKKIKEMRK